MKTPSALFFFFPDQILIELYYFLSPQRDEQVRPISDRDDDQDMAEDFATGVQAVSVSADLPTSLSLFLYFVKLNCILLSCHSSKTIQYHRVTPSAVGMTAYWLRRWRLVATINSINVFSLPSSFFSDSGGDSCIPF